MAAGWAATSARRVAAASDGEPGGTVRARAGHPAQAGALSPDDLALERARQTPKEIAGRSAARIRRKFDIGGWIFGGWVGLVIGVKLISLSLRRKRTDYEPDRGDCFACARCFEYCPNELVRRGVHAAAGCRCRRSCRAAALRLQPLSQR